MTTIDDDTDADLENPASDDVAARTTFPAVTRGRGYDKAAVDEFLLRARSAFEQDDADDAIIAQTVRDASFPLVRHGYAISAVDAALGRIEDAFAARSRVTALVEVGASAWVSQQRDRAQEILDRLTRPPRHRFTRVSVLRYGYRLEEVDLVADKVAGYLADGEKVTVEQIRSVAFRMQRGGYREAQVDAVLDAVVAIMLAVQ